MLIPLHQLIPQGAQRAYNVCHNGEHFVSWEVFVERIGVQVHALKTRFEKRWLLFNDNPINFAVLFFALLHSGKHIVIPPNALPGTLAKLTDTYDAVAIATIPPSPVLNQPEFPVLDTNAVIIDLYTSGSTGNPKKIQKKLSQFEAEIEMLEGLWGDAIGQSTLIATVPHNHIYGLLFRILWPLAAGRTFDGVTCSNPVDIADRIATFDDTVMVSSPAQLSRLFDLTNAGAMQPRPKMIFSSGGALSNETAKQFQSTLGYTPTEVYGSTETGGVAWRCQADSDVWTPFPGIRIHTEVDAQASKAVLYSPFLLNVESTQIDDLVELLPDNTFRLGGRIDKIVKVEQKRLSLTEMEQILCRHHWVSNALALVISRRRDNVAVVIILENAGAQALITLGRHVFIGHLKQHLSLHYDRVLLPRYWRFVESFPINEAGKVTHDKVIALFNNVIYSTTEIVHATT